MALKRLAARQEQFNVRTRAGNRHHYRNNPLIRLSVNASPVTGFVFYNFHYSIKISFK